jgi:hypothetical protein
MLGTQASAHCRPRAGGGRSNRRVSPESPEPPERFTGVYKVWAAPMVLASGEQAGQSSLALADSRPRAERLGGTCSEG